MKKIYLIRHAESEANVAMDLDNPTYYYDAKITKRINDNTYKLCIGSMVTFLVIVPPFIFYYIAIPFATDPNQMLGPSTFVITLLMSIIGYIFLI